MACAHLLEGRLGVKEVARRRQPREQSVLIRIQTAEQRVACTHDHRSDEMREMEIRAAQIAAQMQPGWEGLCGVRTAGVAGLELDDLHHGVGQHLPPHRPTLSCRTHRATQPYKCGLRGERRGVGWWWGVLTCWRWAATKTLVSASPTPKAAARTSPQKLLASPPDPNGAPSCGSHCRPAAARLCVRREGVPIDGVRGVREGVVTPAPPRRPRPGVSAWVHAETVPWSALGPAAAAAPAGAGSWGPGGPCRRQSLLDAIMCY